MLSRSTGHHVTPHAGCAPPAHRVLLADGQRHESGKWLSGGWPTAGGQGRAGGGGRRNPSHPPSAQRRAFAHPLGLAREWLPLPQPATTAAHHLTAARVRARWDEQAAGIPAGSSTPVPTRSLGSASRSVNETCGTQGRRRVVYRLARMDLRRPASGKWQRNPARPRVGGIRCAHPQTVYVGRSCRADDRRHSRPLLWGQPLCRDPEVTPLQTAQEGCQTWSNRQEGAPTTKQSLGW